MADQSQGAEGRFVQSNRGSVHFQAGAPEAAKAEAPAPSPFKSGNQRVRVTINSETGEAVVSTSETTRANVHVGPTGASARNAVGLNIPLAAAGPDDVIDLGGDLGDSKASVFESMGYIVRLPGGGYALPGQTQPVAQQPNPQQPAPKPQVPAVNPSDAAGITPTSQESDNTLRTLQQDTPAAVEGIIASIAKGTLPDFQAIAEQTGDETMPARLEVLHAEMLRSGQQALAKVGVENPIAFENWLRKADPDLANSIVRDMLVDKSVGKLQQAGRLYTQQRQRSIVTKLEAAGVTTSVDHGTVFVSISGIERAIGQSLPRPRGKGDFAGASDTVTLAQAIRNGWIEVAE